MPKKNSKNVKKKEELPSFLLNLGKHYSDRKSYLTQKILFTSPVFFGECKQFHGILHPIAADGLPYPQYSKTSDEYIYPKLFLSKENLVKEAPNPDKVRLRKKRRKEFVDQYPHRCPGVKKVFVPEIKVFTPDFGETSSEIESDTWREIPFCHVKSTLIESSEPEVENITYSDMKEKNRALLPYEQRMAHYHFPKEFITVKLVGPVIPASITITKIPSKRKRMSDFAFEVEEKADKVKSGSKYAAKKETQKMTEEVAEVKTEEIVTEEETEVEEIEIEEEEEEEDVEESYGEITGGSEENIKEEKEKPDEEKETDGELENGAPAVSGTNVEGEEGAVIANEGENVENAMEK